MSGSSRPKRKVRQHDPPKPPLPKTLPPGVVHKPALAEDVELDARRLIRKVGSAEKAKMAVDTAVERQKTTDFREDHFALRCGYSSREALINASTPFSASDGSNWWATRLNDSSWIVWSQDDLSARDRFPSLEDAKRALGDSSCCRGD